jgi:hypothetical protein
MTAAFAGKKEWPTSVYVYVGLSAKQDGWTRATCGNKAESHCDVQDQDTPELHGRHL